MKQRRTVVLDLEEALKILTKVVESKVEGAKVENIEYDEPSNEFRVELAEEVL